jgi:hypothetical protein
MGSAYTECNNGCHHKFDKFDEAYVEIRSNWQEGDTLRFWDELGNPVAIQ